MTTSTPQELIADALKNERHRNHAETVYWCKQYKKIAIEAIAALVACEAELDTWRDNAQHGVR